MSTRAQTLQKFTKSEFLDFKVFQAPLGPVGTHGAHGAHGTHVLKGLRPMPPPGDFSKISKKSNFSKIGQNWFLDWFCVDLGLKFGFCVKNCVGTSVLTSISLFFENLGFYKSVVCLCFTFDGFFEAWEHQNRPQHANISHLQFFGQIGGPNSPREHLKPRGRKLPGWGGIRSPTFPPSVARFSTVLRFA